MNSHKDAYDLGPKDCQKSIFDHCAPVDAAAGRDSCAAYVRQKNRVWIVSFGDHSMEQKEMERQIIEHGRLLLKEKKQNKHQT